jgi:hypothetical protein
LPADYVALQVGDIKKGGPDLHCLSLGVGRHDDGMWERHDVLRQRLGDLRIGWVIVEMSAKVTPILASMQVIH